MFTLSFFLSCLSHSCFFLILTRVSSSCLSHSYVLPLYKSKFLFSNYLTLLLLLCLSHFHLSLSVSVFLPLSPLPYCLTPISRLSHCLPLSFFLLRFISLSTCLSYSLPPSLCFLLSHFLPHPTLIFPLSISLHLYLLISLSTGCHFPPLWLSHSHFPSLSASLLFSPRLSPTPSRFLFLFLSVSLFNSLSFSLPARLTLSFPSLSLRLCRPHWAHHWCV